MRLKAASESKMQPKNIVGKVWVGEWEWEKQSESKNKNINYEVISWKERNLFSHSCQLDKNLMEIQGILILWFQVIEPYSSLVPALSERKR